MSELSHDIKVAGVPRSGTNLAKFIIESHSRCRVCYNYAWWKHAPIPITQDGSVQPQWKMPTIIMFRNPFEQLWSFHKFSQRGGTAIRGDAQLDKFLLGPIRMFDPQRRMEYFCRSPAEYWVLYHRSALAWQTKQKALISLADVRSDPNKLIKAASRFWPQKADTAVTATLPKDYMGRNGGNLHVSEKWNFERQFSTEESFRSAHEGGEIVRSILDAQAKPILRELCSLFSRLVDASFAA